MTEHALGLRGEAGSTVAIGHAGDVFDVKEPCHRYVGTRVPRC